MLIIINDDAAYVSWLSRHRQGFVVDAKRKPIRNHLVLHRSNCPIIKPHKRARLTSGAHLKACSADISELEAWAEEQTGGGLTGCVECQSYEDESPDGVHDERGALTRLGRDILSYVLDLAVMYLDGEQTHYHPTLQDIAGYLGKTPAQIEPAMRRLIVEGHLNCNVGANGNSFSRAVVYPTHQSLRSIPAFEAMPAQSLDAELTTLKGAG